MIEGKGVNITRKFLWRDLLKREIREEKTKTRWQGLVVPGIRKNPFDFTFFDQKIKGFMCIPHIIIEYLFFYRQIISVDNELFFSTDNKKTSEFDSQERKNRTS